MDKLEQLKEAIRNLRKVLENNESTYNDIRVPMSIFLGLIKKEVDNNVAKRDLLSK